MSIRRTSFQVWKVIGINKQIGTSALLIWPPMSMKCMDIWVQQCKDGLNINILLLHPLRHKMLEEHLCQQNTQWLQLTWHTSWREGPWAYWCWSPLGATKGSWQEETLPLEWAFIADGWWQCSEHYERYWTDILYQLGWLSIISSDQGAHFSEP